MSHNEINIISNFLDQVTHDLLAQNFDLNIFRIMRHSGVARRRTTK